MLGIGEPLAKIVNELGTPIVNVVLSTLVMTGVLTLVKANDKGVKREKDAVAVNGPVMALAVNTGAVAMPAALVATVVEPLNTPVAPLPGTAKLTGAPLTGLPNISATAT